MNILAIETSCDETAVAIVNYTDSVFDVRSNIISSQIELHARYGGVVPNLAAREHEKNIIPTVDEALKIAQLPPSDIDLVAVTYGPGLMPALIIGVSAAKVLSYVWQKPLIGIHHIEGHIYANLLTTKKPFIFPLLALVVSGGHTQLVLMREHLQYEIIGQTLDDAVGEAFDKVARMLGLAYPGGPEISQAAAQYNVTDEQYRKFTILPRPMLHSKDYNFSFSGIKTAVLYRIKDFRKEHDLTDEATLSESFVNAMSYAFQEAVTEVLVKKTLKATTEYAIQTVTIAGGVSANTRLRERLGTALKDAHTKTTYLIPEITYCLDNATMIAAAAAIRYEHLSASTRTTLRNTYKTLDANANLKLI